MSKSKVLLLNPPGDKVYLRDYYCSKVSKAGYIYEPPDLVILSGIIAQKHDVQVLDCIALGLSVHESLERVIDYSPDAIIFITGLASFKRDFQFLREVKSRCRSLLIGSGDVFMEDCTKRLAENDFLDAILLDFTDESILSYLDGVRSVRNIVCRGAGGIIEGERVRWGGEEFDIPSPRHDLFPLERYKYTFVKKKKFATVLTDYGCPYKCTFCIMSRIGYKVRDVDGVLEELRVLKGVGITEIYFDDQTFAADRRRTVRLLEAMIRENLRFGWCCFFRADLADEGLIMLMKLAGCHTIIFGVETASQGLRDEYSKGISGEQIEAAFKLCRKHGIDVVATFIIGLPGETREMAEETIQFALKCGCDYASFNVAVPRVGTLLRKEAQASGLIGADLVEMDQSGGTVVMGTAQMGIDEIKSMIDRAVLRFYLRPSYLLWRLSRIKSTYDLTSRLDGMFGILKNIL